MMSCHDPAVALKVRFEGHGVWADRVRKDMSERRLHLSQKTWMAGTKPGHDEKRIIFNLLERA
jgi:hypothetical protein